MTILSGGAGVGENRYDNLVELFKDWCAFEQQVDYQLLRAEMHGFDFNVRVLKSWED